MDWLMNSRIPHHKVVMVPRTLIISESEVTITAMFTPLHSSTNQELFEKYICNQSSHYENYDGAVCVIISNWSIHCPSLSALFN